MPNSNVVSRACLDQLLIVIKWLLIVCDYVRSKTRLIAIYYTTTTRCSEKLCTLFFLQYLNRRKSN